MKRIACILIAILIPLVCSGDGWFFSAGAGGGEVSCTSCTTSNDTAQWDSSQTTAGWSIQARGFAWEFTLASTTCVTGLSWEIFDSGNAGTVIYEIWTGTHAEGPSSAVSGCSATVDGEANIPNSYLQGTETEGLFEATVTLEAGTYFAVYIPGTMTNVVYGYVSDSGANFWHTEDGGSTWSDNNYPGQVRVLGCSPE